MEHLNAALVFPFEAEIVEYQDELQQGDRLVVKKVVGGDDKYDVIVEGRVPEVLFPFD